jgi:choline-sulfatase
LFAKSIVYDHSISVPFVMSGPGIEPGGVVDQIVNHVDLFPTVIETVGGQLAADDADLMGVSLWPAIGGTDSDRVGFSEYHGHGSKSGMYALRRGRYKLLYFVDMPLQVFDLESDPSETNDISATEEGRRQAEALEAELRTILDPEAVDRRAKEDQRMQIERMGGVEACLSKGNYLNNPVPGKEPELFGFDGKE